MQLDHFVIHVDSDSHLPSRIAEDCGSLGFVFDPIGNRNFDSFASHFLYVGLEYLEIIQLKRPNESDWVPQWIERYNHGVRGIYCLFLASHDIELLEKELRGQGFDVKAERSSFIDTAGTEYPFPWRQIYMPAIPDSDVEISFIQYDKPRAELREIFEPNSDKNGLSGIRKAQLSLPNLEGSRLFLEKIFPGIAKTNSGLSVQLENGELDFIRSNTVSLRLSAQSTDQRFDAGELQIVNVSLEAKFR